MEEVLGLLIQVVFEVGLQVLICFGFDFATEGRHTGDERGSTGGCGWLVAFLVFGGLCGGISLMVVPDLILPTLGLRLANLVLAPLFAGTGSQLFAAHVWSARGADPRNHFWRGFGFALAFGLVRLAGSR
ncbi:hypothetical protein [Frigoriglobus tundricola]|uniref:Uncharacterized protein n=1 Tax=Frigoriglobus tundricola TaxID=2774151 RepID=A0A6M5YPX5_9BACT|nr:hypothetical protein [Frigoriglobus tundricola]QJW95978.1 hypothetical protein FTUN_3532 [Frigoriglobus tundricola]